jgi:hypothetical protein
MTVICQLAAGFLIAASASGLSLWLFSRDQIVDFAMPCDGAAGGAGWEFGCAKGVSAKEDHERTVSHLRSMRCLLACARDHPPPSVEIPDVQS